MVRLTDRLDMTIVVVSMLNHKTNKNKSSLVNRPQVLFRLDFIVVP